MNQAQLPYVLLYLCSTFLSSVSQVLLKKAALREHKSVLAEYTDWRVILGYGLFVGWQQVIKHLPLTIAYANKAVTVVWGILLGLAVFGEAVTPRQVIGAVIIICGIVLFVRADNEGEGGQ